MAVDDKPARKRRPEPTRTAPDRTGWSGDPAPVEAAVENVRRKKPPPAKPDPNPDPDPTPAGSGDLPEVSQIVAEAVRIGYHVIGENLKQGRTAADRFRAGSYQADDLPSDINRLGKRMLQLSRDLSTTGFDLLAAVLRDPKILAAIRPSGDDNSDRPPRIPKPTPQDPVPLTCVFRGTRGGTATPTTLQPPPRPTILTLQALKPVGGDHPAITGTRFRPAQAGRGIVAVITIPDDQPAATYTGDVTDEASNTVLGTLTIEVRPPGATPP
ncbi:hypothetical protein GCM10011529_06420 [Polymorphobacter glacialis]|uniref:Uncharacterized protein n=1 Tax=Sandarakinorhabdus glacialis TaxID=1614636 RepID=A0A917E5H3_9SPHN|nr:hypothetical protein [Polymorphobacter glacialis]GGE02663.1 hypothetical protein GCM10011529_06420 [Polymorphobacter glacialis]